MAQMNQFKQYYLQQMGIEPWVLRQPVSSAPNALEDVVAEVSHCTQCVLHQSRTQAVFARGNASAKLMIIGEAPGFYEDKAGEPFVGEAGQLLDKMLLSIGLCESDVYITNVIKCRPPDNRDPKPEEIAHCSRYLDQQIAMIKPDLMLALGRFAGHFLLKKVLPLGKMRGDVHHYDNIPVLVTYHPAYLLRNAPDKGKAYQDLLKVQQMLAD